MEVNENLKEACVVAVAAIEKLKNDDFEAIKAKLVWCVGSYENDSNPVGLYESLREVQAEFVKYKKANPRKIAKKVIDGIEKAINEYEAVAA